MGDLSIYNISSCSHHVAEAAFEVWNMRASARLTLSAVKHAGTEHLVPDLVVVPGILPDYKPLKVLFDQPTGWRTAKASRVSDSSVGRRELDKDASEDTDTP